MHIEDIRFPRPLEADGAAEPILQALLGHCVKLWSGGNLVVPMLTISDPLKSALNQARLKGQLRYGFEQVSEKLKRETEGMAHIQKRDGIQPGERLSRLLLFSNDGAERFYRHGEQLLQTYAPRTLGCLVDIDADTLGKVVTAQERRIKLVMAEHKEAVCEILRALIKSHATAVSPMQSPMQLKKVQEVIS